MPARIGLRGVVVRRADDHQTAAHALADVVVGLAGQVELDAVGQERREALPGRAGEADPGGAAGRQRAVLQGDGARQGGADGPVGVADLVGQVDVVAVPHRPEGVGERRSPRSARGSWRATRSTNRRARWRRPAVRAAGQVHDVGPLVARAALAQQVDPADRLVQRSQAQLGQVGPHLLGHEQEVRGHALGVPVKLARRWGRWVATPGLQVSRWHAQHDAALGDHRRGAEAVLVGPQQGGHDDLAAGEEAAVDPQPHPAAQAVVDQRPLGVGQAQLPGQAACLIDERGLAPVPPFWPLMWTTSARALTQPAAMVPTPSSATSLTDTWAALTCLRS